jgi:hypothetical protein
VFCAKAFEAKLGREKKWFFVGGVSRGSREILQKNRVYPCVFFFAKKVQKNAFFVKKRRFFAIFRRIFAKNRQKNVFFHDFFFFIGGLC